MDERRRWQRIVRILKTADSDVRHLVLDVLPDFMDLTLAPNTLPREIRAEVVEVRTSLDEVRPMFPSHRNTSSLFDREGMGRAGREKGLRLAARIRGVAAAVLATFPPDETTESQ